MSRAIYSMFQEPIHLFIKSNRLFKANVNTHIYTFSLFIYEVRYRRAHIEYIPQIRVHRTLPQNVYQNNNKKYSHFLTGPTFEDCWIYSYTGLHMGYTQHTHARTHTYFLDAFVVVSLVYLLRLAFWDLLDNKLLDVINFENRFLFAWIASIKLAKFYHQSSSETFRITILFSSAESKIIMLDVFLLLPGNSALKGCSQ